MKDRALDASSTADLERACAYRFLALLFRVPDAAGQRELAGLADRVPAPLRASAASLAAGAGAELEAAYHALLGGTGACRDCESDYQVNALGGKGPLIADVAAFYRAFRFPEDAFKLAPDHIAVELEFLGYLAMKTAYARYAGLAAEQEICTNAEAAFVRDHLAAWAPSFLAALEAQASDGFFAGAADFARRALDALAPPVQIEA